MNVFAMPSTPPKAVKRMFLRIGSLAKLRDASTGICAGAKYVTGMRGRIFGILMSPGFVMRSSGIKIRKYFVFDDLNPPSPFVLVYA